MDQQTTTDAPVQPQIDWNALWGVPLEQANCTLCDASYLLPESMARFGKERCPNCSRAFLEASEHIVANPDFARQPELLLPFSIKPEQAVDRMLTFTQQIKSPSPDLKRANLSERLRRVYVPVWLVDSTVQGQWGAEAGFNYQVVSHQEKHQGGKWVSYEVKKNRIEWEPRVGTIKRRYDNVLAAALEGYFKLEQNLNHFDENTAGPFQTDQLSNAYILLPDRSTDDAWQNAHLNLKDRAKTDIMKAMSADQGRDFKWTPQYTDFNWTLLLVPVYTSYYFDDDKMPQVLFVNGQRGTVNGALRGSVKRGQRFIWPGLAVASTFFIASLLIALVGVLVNILEVLLISVAGVMLAVAVAVIAFLPVAIVTTFNRNHEGLHVAMKPYRPELNQTLG